MRRTLTHEERKAFVKSVRADVKPAALAKMFGITRPTAAEYGRYIRNGGMPYTSWKQAIADVAEDLDATSGNTNDYGIFEVRDRIGATFACREPHVGLIRRAWRFIW